VAESLAWRCDAGGYATRSTQQPNIKSVEEYLTIAEVAAKLKIKPKTIKNKMAAGIFKRGVHYFSPQGLGPRFKWSAVVAWLERSETSESDNHDDDAIPMARRYQLGNGNHHHLR
jgi:hypothetical protein